MIEFLRPPDDPINYGAHDYKTVEGRSLHMVEVSYVMRRDWAIRNRMERALQYDDETVLAITKLFGECVPIHFITLKRPFVLPKVHPGNLDLDNSVLRSFAFEAYDKINDHYEKSVDYVDGQWGGWVVAPYFTEGDDTRQSFNLGVFIDEHILETVVE